MSDRVFKSVQVRASDEDINKILDFIFSIGREGIVAWVIE